MPQIKAGKQDAFARYLVLAAGAAGVLLGLWWRPAVLLAFGLQAVYLLRQGAEQTALLLFFMLPFASVYKLRPGAMSLFTVLELLAVCLLALRARRCSLWVLTSGALLGLYALCSPGRGLTAVLKLLLLLFLFYCLSGPAAACTGQIAETFACGLLVSSAFSLLCGRMPAVARYVQAVYSYTPRGEVWRFTGLYSDPNYYAVNLVVCKFTLLLVWARQGPKRGFWGLSVGLSACLLLTVSKSAVIMYTLYLLVLAGVLLRRRRLAGLGLLCGLALAFWLACRSDWSYFALLRARFRSADLNGLTTGRLAWLAGYARFAAARLPRLLFGVGAGQPYLRFHGRPRAPHNTGMDLLYYLGLAGAALLCLSLVCIWRLRSRPVRRGPLHWMPLLSMGMTYFFLSGLFSIDVPFHLALVCAAWNLPAEELQKEGEA